jgi:alkylated DNA repair dioxygenase AlkB
VDGEPWLTDLKRRVQHYRYRYDYKARRVDPSMHLGPLPAWVQSTAERLVHAGHMPKAPDQLIVNEYQPGQGISPHIDCEPCFGPAICSLSLGSPCVMDFTEEAGGWREPLRLERGSLVVLSGPARYDWKHSIAGRKADRIEGRAISRDRRVSLTFRTVLM